MREYVREKEGRTARRGSSPTAKAPMSDTNLWRYLARADREVEKSFCRSKKRLSVGTCGQAPQPLRQGDPVGRLPHRPAACDQAELLGLYPGARHVVSGPKDGPIEAKVTHDVAELLPPPASSTPSSDPHSMRERIERYVRTVRANPWIPHAPSDKQALFLLHDDVEEAPVRRGGRRGQVRRLCSMAAAQFVDVPGYAALPAAAAPTPTCASPGAIMDRAHDVVGGKAARWSDRDKRWTLPGRGHRSPSATSTPPATSSATSPRSSSSSASTS